MNAAGGYRQDHHECCRLDEADEVLVVSFANTGTKPRAVVVKALDTAITDAAVDGAGRTVDVTG